MKRVIRRNVYETNSSSVHSLVISPDGLEPSKLPVDADGYILTDFGTFGRDKRIFSSQADKLSYLITQCYYINGGYNTDLSDSWIFSAIEEAICEYTGAKGIRIIGDHEPYIDHQMAPSGELNFGINEYNYNEINSFVFNKYVAFTTDWD